MQHSCNHPRQSLLPLHPDGPEVMYLLCSAAWNTRTCRDAVAGIATGTGCVEGCSWPCWGYMYSIVPHPCLASRACIHVHSHSLFEALRTPLQPGSGSVADHFKHLVGFRL